LSSEKRWSKILIKYISPIRERKTTPIPTTVKLIALLSRATPTSLFSRGRTFRAECFRVSFRADPLVC
jgi:hypothetical protein